MAVGAEVRAMRPGVKECRQRLEAGRGTEQIILYILEGTQPWFLMQPVKSDSDF